MFLATETSNVYNAGQVNHNAYHSNPMLCLLNHHVGESRQSNREFAGETMVKPCSIPKKIITSARFISMVDPYFTTWGAGGVIKCIEML